MFFKRFVDYLFLTLGALLCAVSLQLILAPNELVDGGVTAISIMISEVTGLPIWLFFLAINTPVLLLSAKALGSQFMVRALYCNIVVTAGLYFLRPLPAVTYSEVLIVLYGGLLLGLGVGLCVRNGGAIDGTEILAIWINRHFHVPISSFLLGINVIILTFAAFVFDLEKAMFSVAVFFLVTKVIDFVLEGINKVVSVMIISEHPAEVTRCLTEELEVRVTLLYGEGGYTGEPRRIIYCVTDRFSYPRLRLAVLEVDPGAILEASIVTEATGIQQTPMREVFADRARSRKAR